MWTDFIKQTMNIQNNPTQSNPTQHMDKPGRCKTRVCQLKC